MSTSKTKLSESRVQSRGEHRRIGGMVSSSHLEAWAGSPDAWTTMPLLLRALIRRTNKSVESASFTDGELSDRPSLAGKVVATIATEFVPDHLSAWEAGVCNQPEEKANEDYDLRTGGENEVNLAISTFIFVTPRKWTTKQDWIDQKKAEGIWNDVRVYDSTDLEDWLAEAPVVDLWLATRLGISSPGFRSIDDNWRNVAANEGVALAG